jgi:outer membrane protein OmpA-like peptidoglycan-associated protein
VAAALAACDGPTTPPPGDGAKTPATPTPEPPPPTEGPPATEPVTADAPVDKGEPIDLLTFAQGVIPVAVGGPGAGFGATFEEAVEAIDGDPTPYAMVRQAPADVVTEFVYELPAPTTFTRLAVPNVRETPSAFQTFTRTVEVLGSTTSATDGFALLGSATLATHAGDGEVTDLALKEPAAVRWVKLRLGGGIAIESEKSTIQFSELVAHGVQQAAPRLDRFSGSWRARGVAVDLRQDGALVSGCYDDVAELSGTVSGNILRARGVEPRTKVVSLFVLNVAPDGALRGLRSTNGAPFRTLTSPPAPAGTKVKCPSLAPPKLGCGSIIHGIQFEFDSAELRPDSEPVLARLFEGLSGDTSAKVAIEGHTSSEGKDPYNLDLSQRRADAVVADLVRRGLARERLVAVGRGEAAPIASNDDEAGRSMNRRVEIRCE